MSVRRKHMSGAARQPKSYTIEPEVNDYISETKGNLSASQRVNELLTKAIELEQRAALALEAQMFFAMVPPSERGEEKAFRKASIRAITRGES